jgi:hypothetical protein
MTLLASKGHRGLKKLEASVILDASLEIVCAWRQSKQEFGRNSNANHLRMRDSHSLSLLHRLPHSFLLVRLDASIDLN